MKKEIIKNDDGTEVTVLIELKKRTLARDPRMTFTTRMVKTMLENDKIKVDKCVISDTIDNNSDMSKRSGKWVFSLIKEVLAPIPKTAEPTDGIYSDSLLEEKPVKKKRTRKKKGS
jgi:hypothetical protein